jgi:lipopolysaccharide/colanic/teichoic acid biosynthesis glycosyltransferase
MYLDKKVNDFLKRVFDIMASLCGLIVLSPLMVLVAIFVKFDSPGKVFYLSKRTGRHGVSFKMIKFRTMVAHADNMAGGPFTALHDPRLTRIARFLRKYKLNELPQLINVLHGEMSIVGPRPQVEEYTKLYNNEEKIILSVRPGLTDYASVKFIDMDKTLGDENIEEKYLREVEPEKIRLRIKYARENSVFIDLAVLFKTIIALLGLTIHGIPKIRRH